jgi:plasmid segregation protein ParM
MLLGIDAGNKLMKVVTQNGVYSYLSMLGDWRPRKWNDQHGADDIEFEHEGQRGFAGTLAEAESRRVREMMGDTKAHEDAKLRILIAIHRYSDDFYNDLVVGQPIDRHVADEKHKLKALLRGEHTIAVNGETKTFVVSNVEVAAEGVSAFWSQPRAGLVRIIDAGSGTINCATIRNKRKVEKDSFSLPYGMYSERRSTMEDATDVANSVAAGCLGKWQREDEVIVAGGSAHELAEPLRKHFRKVSVIQPNYHVGNRVQIVEPVFANAVGYFNIGRALYGEGA